MDWFTIVLILIFFVFPVIQQILEAKKGRGGTLEDADEAPLEPLERQVGRVDQEVGQMEQTRRPDPADVEWSSGWGSWPGSTTKVEESRETSADAENRGPILINYEAPARAIEKPALQQVTPRPSPTLRPPIQVRPVEIGAIEPTARVNRPKRAATWDDPGALLETARNPASMRKIIVLTEILGKPKSLAD